MVQAPDAPERSALIGIVVIVLILITLGVLAMSLLPTDTEYAPGYAEAAFDSIELGDPKQLVLETLGPPLSSASVTPSRAWLYCDPSHPGYGEDGNIRGTFTEFTFDLDGRVRSLFWQVESAGSEGFFSREVRVTLGPTSSGFPRRTPRP